MSAPEKPRGPHYTSSTHIPIDRVQNIPTMRPKLQPDIEWRARVDDRLNLLESAMSTTAGEVRVEFSAAVTALRNHVANAIPAAVDAAMLTVKIELEAQNGVLDKLLTNSRLAAAEQSARLQLQRESDEREERVASLRALNTQSELTIANTKKILVEAQHLADSDPKVDGRNRRRNATIATISGLIIALAALAGLAANSQHQAPHLPPPPADEPHH